MVAVRTGCSSLSPRGMHPRPAGVPAGATAANAAVHALAGAGATGPGPPHQPAGQRDYAQILRRTRLKESELKQVLALIQSLDPNPGQSIGQDRTEYVVPDVFVSKKDGRWVVELNPDIAPKLRINSNYAGLIKRADSSADNTFLRDNLQEARWFLKSLHSRNETLMKVATRIVEHQRNFLEYGTEAMKPLVLHEIAELVEMNRPSRGLPPRNTCIRPGRV